MSDARESMEFDVVIVGAGPAGLAAAIRLKQRALESGNEISVCILEKGAEVGAHILSGAIIDPIGLNALFPDWKARGAPVETPVTDDRFYFLGPAGQIRIPHFLMPPLMSNHGNYIASLGLVCRWLAREAEALGVEIYPGFAAVDVETGEKGEVAGVITGDLGVARDGHHKPNYTPGMALRGKYVLIAEGARGSLAKQLITRFELAKGRAPQTFGLGLKELWELPKESHRPALFCTAWAGRSTIAPAAAPFSISMETISRPSVSSSTWTIAIRTCRPSMSSSAGKRIRSFGRCSKADAASPMARVRSRRVVCKPCPRSRFPEAR
jgi:electron-transferring-flavoprotein dehydrogenase